MTLTCTDMQLRIKAESSRTITVETSFSVDAVPVETYVGYDFTLVYV